MTISLSNLFKQQYLVNAGSGIRVINADARFANMNQMPEPVGYTGDEIMSEGERFYEGLQAEEIFIEPEPSVEEILEEARQEAEHMIAQAQAKIPIQMDAIAHFVFFCLWYALALHNSFTPKASATN